jgi:PIN domain nuclease of toxin-antitoxin system
MASRRRPTSEHPIVLDTHVWIWSVEGLVHNLAPHALTAIEAAAREGRLYVAVISTWEIAMLVKTNRLTLSRDVPSWIAASRRPPGTRIAPLTSAIALDSTALPALATNDPADRFIAATARALGAYLATCDAALLDYGKTGQLLTLDARP